MRRSVKIYVKIIVVYQTKKTCFFLLNKDKIPDSCKANVVYEFSCPGCGHSYTECIKKLNKFEIALNVAKRLQVWSFLLT